jgi:hypothetical protein
MSTSDDPFAPPPEQQRATWFGFAMLAALWLTACAFAFALMIGWI